MRSKEGFATRAVVVRSFARLHAVWYEAATATSEITEKRVSEH